MKNVVKLVAVSVFALAALFIFLSGISISGINAAGFSPARATPTPPKNENSNVGNTAANSAANSNATASPAAKPSNTAANSSTASGSGKKVQTVFHLGTDSLDPQNGDVQDFDHEAHASNKEYSEDGKSEVTCIECHHTDQAKSKLKLPYSTSERDEELTMAVWQKSDQKVSDCRACHFQNDDLVPDGKTMPTDAKGTELTNKIAYHRNCNSCHDAAFSKRPDLKSKNKKFATSDGKDCAICHKSNS